ncbi:hypothetical protein CN975_25310, partial [Bacillus cereus]
KNITALNDHNEPVSRNQTNRERRHVLARDGHRDALRGMAVAIRIEYAGETGVISGIVEKPLDFSDDAIAVRAHA